MEGSSYSQDVYHATEEDCIQLTQQAPEHSQSSAMLSPVLRQRQKSKLVHSGGQYGIVPFGVGSKSSVTVGRSKQADITMKPLTACTNQKNLKELQSWHLLISNTHCHFTSKNNSDPTEVTLTDDSGNGTFVNGIRLRRGDSRVLSSGDEISLIHPNHPNLKWKNYDKNNNGASFFGGDGTRIESDEDGEEMQQRILAHYSFTFVSPPPLPNSKPSGFSTAAPAVNPRMMNMSASSLSLQQQSIGDNAINTISYSRKSKESSTSMSEMEQKYELLHLLGKGQCGEVRLAKPRHTNTDNCYAIKTIPLPHRDHSSRYSFYNTSNATPTRKMNSNPILQDAKREAKLLQTIHHPYIIRLQETFFECTAVHLVMEYASGGDLFERIVERTKLTETVTRRLTRRLFNAMHYLHHKHRMVHRDLKPENILLSSKTNDYLCKISDFGVAKIMPTEDVGLKTFCGTPQYFAPEVFRRRFTVQKRGRYDYQADVWSLGVILYICLFGMFPFGDDDEEADDNANLSYYGKLTFPCTASHSNSEMTDRSANNAKDDPGSLTIVSKAAQDMIQKLLTVNPEHRIKLNDACNHEWIQIEDGDTHRHPLRDPVINDKDKENEINKEKHYRPQDAVVSCSPKMGTKKKKKRQNLNHTQSKKKKKDVVQSTLLGGKVIVRQDNVEDKTVTEVHDHNDKPSSFENDGNENCNTDRRQNSSSLKSSRPQQQTTLSKWIKTVAKK